MPVPETLVNEINEVRDRFIKGIDAISKTTSFKTLLHNSEELQREWKRQVLDIVESPRVTRKCTGTFTCAFVGACNAGKTTTLRELFPELGVEARNWFVCKVKDTTSQALRICIAANGNEADTAVVRSWGMEEIGRLMAAARQEHEQHGISVTEHAQFFDVNAEGANLPDRQQFLFGLRYPIRPLGAQAYHLKKARQDTINRLTVKMDWADTNTEPMTFGEHALHALQLRAVVKEVELRDNFKVLAKLAGRPVEQISKLVFLDTPGLSAAELKFDEILQFALFHKNRHIITELLRNDELDLIVHLVLAGDQSNFRKDLWKKIEQEFPGDIADLGERLIVAINGMGKFLTEPNISKYWREQGHNGDQFRDVVDSNILATMHPLRPAHILFLDSKEYLERAKNQSYEEFFAHHRPEMERWIRPGGTGYDTLRRLGLLESFRENIDAVCNPNDRGQGHLVRVILDLIERHGSRLTVRKHLVRSQLKNGIDQARQILLRYYDAATGGLDKWQIVQQVIRKFLPSITPDDLTSIGFFYERHLRRHVDTELDRYLPKPDGSLDTEIQWIKFNINEASLKSLQEEGVADETLSGLARLRGKVFVSEDQFLTALTQLPGALEWKEEILSRARDAVWVRTAFQQVCKTFYNTVVALSARFRITDQVLSQLRNSGMPPQVSRKLLGLKGQAMESLEQFEAELRNIDFTRDDEWQWRDLLVQIARVPINDEASRNQTFFADYFKKQVNLAKARWGYRVADLPVPTQHNPTPVDMVRHIVHLHLQELLFQMINGANNDPAKNTLQDPRDRAQVLAVLQSLEQAQRSAEILCQRHGVQA